MKATKRTISKMLMMVVVFCMVAACSISVSAAKFHLNATSITLYKGQNYQLNASVSGVKWSSKKKAVAAVNASGLVTAKKTGKTTITAKANGETVKCTVTVKAPTIKLNKKTASIAVGKKLNLKATVGGASSQVKWKSSNKKCASVNASGKVTAKKTGKVTITATANGKTAKCTVTVKKLSKDQATKALFNYVDRVYDLDTVYQYNGNLEYNKKLADKYEFNFWSYTNPDIMNKFYVNAANGSIQLKEQNPFTGEWEKTVTVAHVKDYM